LRQDLGQLVQSLDRAGYHAEVAPISNVDTATPHAMADGPLMPTVATAAGGDSLLRDHRDSSPSDSGTGPDSQASPDHRGRQHHQDRHRQPDPQHTGDWDESFEEFR
jgi:hypothetical protein